MKVKIKDLHPNPFRDLSSYPFNKEKIEQLKTSIEATGFWDNILARQVNGHIQIAYGHHRLKALREVFTPDHLVEVPVKDLSDELMLKIMANENMDEWQSSVAVIDETVRAAIKFLGTLVPNNVEEKRKYIADFFRWHTGTVTKSLQRINAIEKGEADKQAVESIPTAKGSTAFTAAVKGKNLTTGQQRRVATRIAKSENYSPQSIKLEVAKEAAPKPTKKDVEDKQQKQLMINFDHYLANVTDIASKLKNEVQKMRGMKAMIRNYKPEQFENRLMLKLSLESLQKTIINTLKELDNE